MADGSGARQHLSGTLPAGATTQITATGRVQVGSRGDSILLLDPTGTTTDPVTYKQDQVRTGHTICFGRTS